MSGVMDQLGCKSYKKSAYGGTDVFNDVQGKYTDFWNGSSSLLHDRFLDEDDTAWKHAGLNGGTRTKLKNVPDLMLETSHLSKRCFMYQIPVFKIKYWQRLESFG
ncbi:hypothetical protein Droror1_Dr00027797 [Drosera rotundifolia]